MTNINDTREPYTVVECMKKVMDLLGNENHWQRGGEDVVKEEKNAQPVTHYLRSLKRCKPTTEACALEEISVRGA